MHIHYVVCVCMCVLLEVLQKIHDPLALGLFELVALPVPDTLSIFCQRQKISSQFDTLALRRKRTSLFVLNYFCS